MAYDLTAALDDLVKNYVGGQGPSAPGATPNNPGGGLDAATRARLAQARAADAAAVQAARGAPVAGAAPPAGAAPAAAATPPKAGFGARAASVLNPSMGGLAKAGGVLGKATLAVAPAMGLISAAADSEENVSNFAGSMGLDYNTFGGRLGANTLNFLRKTGDAATFGIAGRLGRVLAGGSFFEDDAPAQAASADPAATMQAETVSDLGPNDIRVPLVDFGKYTVAGAADSQSPPVEDGQPADTSVVRRAIGRPEAYGGYIEGPNGRIELPSGTVQRFGVRRRTLAENIDAARAKHSARADAELGIKAAEAGARLKSAGKSSAEEEIARAKISAANAYIKANPTDYGGYVAILAGKDPKESQGTIASPTGSTSLVQRDNTVVTTDAQGNVVRRPIFRQPTEGEVSKMKANMKDPTYKAAFLRNFGPEAYKTYIESR